MKKSCDKCPYRKDVKPFLTPRRGEMLALHAYNPYSSFPCHKTTVPDEDCEDGSMMAVGTTKGCAGFLTLRINEGAKIPEGFTPETDLIYSNIDDMIEAYKK